MRYAWKPDPAAFVLGMLCLLAAGVLHAASFEGRIVKSDGQVSVTSAAGEPVDLAAAGNVVRETQTISTGADGMAIVQFNNGSITVLDPNSRLQVKTPNWFVHLAGKAFFTFKKLVGQADERRVQNTVALIGIRGTEFISYETDQTAVALDEGSLNLQTLGSAFDLAEDGTQSQAAEFVLDEKQMVTFDGTAATVTAFTPAVLADFAAFRTFGGDLLGDFNVDFAPGQTAGAAGAAGAATVAAAATEEEKPDEEKDAERADDDDDGFGQFYIGAGLGLSVSDTDEDGLLSDLENAGYTITNIDFEDTSQAGKLFAGYYFTRNFGVEVGYTDLGKFDSTIQASIPSGSEQQFAEDVVDLHPVSATGIYAAGVLRVNLLVVSLIAKGGVYAWEGDVETSLPTGVTVDTSKDGTDAMFGLGLDLPILPIRIEAEHYYLDDGGVNVLFADLIFHF
jgi:hypothetical protein